MMNGPQHYAEAEKLIGMADQLADRLAVQQQANIIASAQVHATLALAAATIEGVASRGPGDVSAEWSDAVWNR